MLLRTCPAATGVAIHEYGLDIHKFIIRRQITYLLGKSLLHCLLGNLNCAVKYLRNQKILCYHGNASKSPRNNCCDRCFIENSKSSTKTFNSIET